MAIPYSRPIARVAKIGIEYLFSRRGKNREVNVTYYPLHFGYYIERYWKLPVDPWWAPNILATGSHFASIRLFFDYLVYVSFIFCVFCFQDYRRRQRDCSEVWEWCSNVENCKWSRSVTNVWLMCPFFVSLFQLLFSYSVTSVTSVVINFEFQVTYSLKKRTQKMKWNNESRIFCYIFPDKIFWFLITSIPLLVSILFH